MTTTRAPVGVLLRQWRELRHLSQLDLAVTADVSTRHLSHVETGKSRPTSAMIERLAEHLDVPLRHRNTLLLSGGYAPAYPERQLTSPSMAAVSGAIRQILAAHLPYPALVIDGHWEMVDANEAVARLVQGAAAELLEPPVNVLRLSLHPDGLAPRIVNLGQWRSHLLGRLEHQIFATGDSALAELRTELVGYPGRGGSRDSNSSDDAIIVPLSIRVGAQVLDLFSTTTVFGAPMDVTVDEIAIESFYPANPETAEALRNHCR